MTKTELVTLIREVVRHEFKAILQTPEGKKLVREIIKNEVRSEVDMLLTEMESQPTTVIHDTPTDVRLSRMVERGELPNADAGKSKQLQEVSFSKNTKLNKALNQTLKSIVSGEAEVPSAVDPEAEMDLLREQYRKGFVDARQRQSQNPVDEQSGKTVAQMMPRVDVEGNPINTVAVPQHVQRALTRDYRKLMKKVG